MTLHFADNPDDMLCGRVAIKTLCGGQFQDTTNWDVGNVTCERCLEVMEERAAGVEKVPVPLGAGEGKYSVSFIHDEIIVERELTSYPSFTYQTWAEEIKKAYEQKTTMEKWEKAKLKMTLEKFGKVQEADMEAAKAKEKAAVEAIRERE